MCGIFVVISKTEKINLLKLQKALHLLTHRGPDTNHYEIFQLTGNQSTMSLGLCHTRLAIIDPKSRSDQPFGDKNISKLVFNGELYNYKDVYKQLLSNIHLKTSSDTEVLYYLIKYYGIEIISQLEGMWSFSYIDFIKNHIYLGRDRYGQKPLFYYHDEDIFIASSEIKPISHYLDMRLTFQDDIIPRYLLYGPLFLNDNHSTHFKKIYQIPPGSYAKLDLINWALYNKNYFSPYSYFPQNQGNLSSVFTKAVKSRLISDRPVGLLLSGGIDSSLILSVLVKEKLADNVQCFIGNTGKSDDTEYAIRCAKKVNIKPVIINIDYEYNSFDRFLKICFHQEKPFSLVGNALAMPMMYQAISEHNIPVVLDGTGGDEIFGGYIDRYMPFAIKQAIQANDDKWLSTIKIAYHDNKKITNIIERVIKEKGVTTVTRKIPLSIQKYFSSSVIHQIKDKDPFFSKPIEFAEALLIDSYQGRLSEWLWQNDRNAMMFSIENRSPFLDYRLNSFRSKSYTDSFNSHWGKIALRDLFNSFIPLPTQWRKEKQGFRWNNSSFMKKNEEKIMDIIHSSNIIKNYLKLDDYVNDYYKGLNKIDTGLMPKLLCIAGLEHVLNI